MAKRNLCDTTGLCWRSHGIQREHMPQIDGPVEKFVDYLESCGISVDAVILPAKSIHATQSELDGEKVEAISEDLGVLDETTFLVSEDLMILDGHHRWAAAFLADPNHMVSCLRVNVPMGHIGTGGLLDIACAYDGSSREKFASRIRP